MNTSNKILVGFCLIVFLVPALMVMALKSKVRNDEFVIVTRDAYSDGNWRSGKLQAGKVVKITGIPGNALKVNLSYKDTASYSYSINSGDSLRIQEQGDTVFINYMYKGTNPGDESEAGLYLELSLPSPEHLTANNTEVNLLSFDSSGTKNISMELMGTSRLTMGLTDENKFDGNRLRADFIKINELSVIMNGADLYLGKTVSIKKMNVEARGSAGLTIDEHVDIDDITGSLSDSSSVEASWNYLKRLTALPAQ